MLRVQPNGARSRVFRFRPDGMPRRVTLGKPDVVKADHAWTAALAFLAREKGGDDPLPLPASGPTLARFAVEYVERRSPSWKPSTVKATLGYPNSAILPALGHLSAGSVVRAHIVRFFYQYARRKSDRANRSHEILRNMFDCAIVWGHRPEPSGNPCKGMVRCHRPLVGAVLRQREGEKPGCVAAVRMPLLTVCRPGEITCLRWCEVKPNRLILTDTKAGPRQILHGEAARALLNNLAETASGEWVFPGKGRDASLTSNELHYFWITTRDAAGIVPDARLHVLRHAQASHGVMNWETLYVAGHLPGQRQANRTIRYVDLDDATLSQAAERVAGAIRLKLHGMGQACHRRTQTVTATSCLNV